MSLPGQQSREFDCDNVKSELEILCKPGDSEYHCRPFRLNVCSVSPEEQEQLCKDGYAETFYSNFPCYCDDRCLSKIGATCAGIIFGFSLLIGLICVALRRCRKPVSDAEIEKRLSVPRSDKPDPRVSQCSINSFKWIPFFTCVIFSLWLIISTGIVIGYHDYPKVSVFQVWYMMISTTLMVFWLVSSICLLLNGVRGLHILKHELAKEGPVEHTDTVHHMVVLPNYMEDTDVLRTTILRLAEQENVSAKKNTTIVLAMEQGEDGYWAKGTQLRDEFLPVFRDVIVTCHPRLPGEQPGKSSNMKWSYAAMQHFATTSTSKDRASSQTAGSDEEKAFVHESATEKDADYAKDSEVYFNHRDLTNRTKASTDFSFDPENTVVTLMDADALSHIRFLATLGKTFEETDGVTKHLRFWQCPVAFYENLNEVDFINRAVSIIFAFNELANTGVIDLGLSGCNPRVPVNTYSMSWRLFDLIEGGDNFVVADESHNLFKAFHLSKGLVKLDPIFLPISVYNVTSDKFFTGFKARFTQIKRWMYGNAFEFSFWFGRYVGCSRSQNWPIPLLDKLPILWRLFVFSSLNLVQPLFFCFYGLSWAFYLKTPYFKTLATVLVTAIMTIFMIINASIFIMHWLYINQLNIEPIKKWPIWKKICVTIFDAIIGVGAATVFYVYGAGLAANGQLLRSGGLKWGTEGRAKQDQDREEDVVVSIKKDRSSKTVNQAKFVVKESMSRLSEA